MSGAMDHARVRWEVNGFRLWREAQAVGFRCTAEELAEATGIAVSTVRDHAARRGWRLESNGKGTGRVYRRRELDRITRSDGMGRVGESWRRLRRKPPSV